MGDEQKQKKTRLRAGEEPGVGDQRYLLIRNAARRISQAIKKGYWLEAVTLIESILTERLEKRAQYLHAHPEHVPSGALVAVKDGFANLGPLINALKSAETDSELKAMLAQINQWRDVRNKAVHEMAKLGRGARDAWEARLERAQRAAKDGIRVLLEYDLAERRVSHESRRRRFASATCPDALASIGQGTCSYCRAGHDASAREVNKAPGARRAP